jgi:hypothetical protein
MANELQYILIDGVERPLGCLPRQHKVGSLFPTLDTVIPLVPEDQWQDTEFDEFLWYTYDQNGYGSCNANAACGALLGTRRYAGERDVVLSPGDLYRRINGGRDQGSIIGDAIAELVANGVCDVNTFPEQQWKASPPAGWQQNAAQFKAVEFFDCPTFEHIATAMTNRLFVDHGIDVGNNYVPDENGVIPPYRGGGGGHAQVGCGLKKINGIWHIKTKNSWGRWGLKGTGICYIPRSYFTGGYNDAWAMRAASHTPQN